MLNQPVQEEFKGISPEHKVIIGGVEYNLSQVEDLFNAERYSENPEEPKDKAEKIQLLANICEEVCKLTQDQPPSEQPKDLEENQIYPEEHPKTWTSSASHVLKKIWSTITKPLYWLSVSISLLWGTVVLSTGLDGFLVTVWPTIPNLVLILSTLIFASAKQFLFYKFELNLLKVTFGLQTKKEIDAVLAADRKIIKTTLLIKEYLANNKDKNIQKSNTYKELYKLQLLFTNLINERKNKLYNQKYQASRKEKFIFWGAALITSPTIVSGSYFTYISVTGKIASVKLLAFLATFAKLILGAKIVAALAAAAPIIAPIALGIGFILFVSKTIRTPQPKAEAYEKVKKKFENFEKRARSHGIVFQERKDNITNILIYSSLQKHKETEDLISATDVANKVSSFANVLHQLKNSSIHLKQIDEEKINEDQLWWKEDYRKDIEHYINDPLSTPKPEAIIQMEAKTDTEEAHAQSTKINVDDRTKALDRQKKMAEEEETFAPLSFDNNQIFSPICESQLYDSRYKSPVSLKASPKSETLGVSTPEGRREIRTFG